MLVWDFFYRVRLWGKGEVQVMRGVSHLQFDDQGKVCYHRDDWDTSEELYMKPPVLGALMRGLRKVLARLTGSGCEPDDGRSGCQARCGKRPDWCRRFAGSTDGDG